MDSVKLKPCPFCGGEARLYVCDSSGAFFTKDLDKKWLHGRQMTCWQYKCTRCGIMTKPYLTRRGVWNAWNRRANDENEDYCQCGLECIRTNAERICVKPAKGPCPFCEQTVGRNLELEAIYSQVSNALCGRENATLNEVLQAASQVKAELVKVRRERDVAAKDADLGQCCATCLHRFVPTLSEPCKYCSDQSLWKWRGICTENTEVSPDA